MGGGSTTKEKGVTKSIRKLPGEKDGFGGGGGMQNSSRDTCIFSVTLAIDITSDFSGNLSVGDKAAIIPEKGNAKIILAGNSLGEYKGKYHKRIIECFKKGYVYEGEVSKIEDNTVFISIHGSKL